MEPVSVDLVLPLVQERMVGGVLRFVHFLGVSVLPVEGILGRVESTEIGALGRVLEVMYVVILVV